MCPKNMWMVKRKVIRTILTFESSGCVCGSLEHRDLYAWFEESVRVIYITPY